MAALARRLALVAGALGVAAGLISGASYAMFTGSASGQENTFAAGTVTLGETAESSPCTVANMEPGDSSSSLLFPGTNDSQDSSCAYEVQYQGSLPAWIGLTVTSRSTANAPGTEALLDGQPGGLQVIIQDSYGNHFTLGAITCSAPYPDASLCQSNAPDQLVAKVGQTFVNPDHSVNSGWSDTFVINYALPLASPNPYQGGTAQITLTGVAVQASNNPLVGSPPGPLHGWG